MKKGFTLIEILLALAITATIISFIYSSFFVTFKTYNALEYREKSFQNARAIFERLTNQFQSSYFDYIPKLDLNKRNRVTYFIGIDNFEGSMPADRVIFSTLAGGYQIIEGSGILPWGDSMDVDYFTELDSETGLLNLYARQDVTIDDDPMTGGISYPLVFGIKGINFRYYDGYTKEWKDTWDTRESGNWYLPSLVEVTLIIPNSNKNNVEEEDTGGIVLSDVIEIPFKVYYMKPNE